MPTEFSAVQVRAGLYLVVTSRCRGSTGVATGAPRYTSPSPSTRYRAAKTISRTSCGVASPLTRLMNSMFHGVHGASERTPCMYRSMASRVAGSSHDSGSRTVRDGTRSSFAGGSVVLDPLQQRQQRPRGQPRGVGVNLQRPDARA